MSTQFDSSLLSGYLDGELDADEMALVERVLDEQPERLRELEALRHLQRSIATLPTPQPTVDPVTAVRARIEQKRPMETESPRRWWLQVTPFALAACLLLAAGWMMLGSDEKPAQLASDRVASPANEMASERAESFDDTDSTSPTDAASFSQLADQPPSDASSPEILPESLGRRDVGDERRLARDGRPAQLFIEPSEPTSPSARSPELRSQAGDRPRSLDMRLDEEKASPGAMGGFGGAVPSSEADEGLARRFSSPPQADDAAYGFRGRDEAFSEAMSLEATTAAPPELGSQRAVRLRYEVPEEEHAETVRWLRTVVPRELKELSPAGDVKRYWFFGYQQEQQDLQAAIKKRLEVTDGELNVVQSAMDAISAEREAISVEAAPSDLAAGRAKAAESQSQRQRQNRSQNQNQNQTEKLSEMRTVPEKAVEASPLRASDGEPSRRAAGRRGGLPESRRTSDAEGQPTAIIIEMFAQPKE